MKFCWMKFFFTFVIYMYHISHAKQISFVGLLKVNTYQWVKALFITVIVGRCWLLILYMLLFLFFFFPLLGTWWRSRSFYSQNVEIIDIWNRSQENWSCEVKLCTFRVPFQISSFPSFKGPWKNFLSSKTFVRSVIFFLM